MPTVACQYFYECEKLQDHLKPKQGDCCVYCSYGNVSLPTNQQDKNVAKKANAKSHTLPSPSQLQNKTQKYHVSTAD